jgi:AbiV family abortive infection protein
MEQYRGKLSVAQVVEGMNAALHNGRALLEDASLLFDAKRFARACSLAILSIEECGKIPILRGMLAVREDKPLRAKWREYRSHQMKNVMWILPELVVQGAKKLAELRRIFDPDAEHPKFLDDLKQIGFYTDCLGKANWSRPEVVINEDLATSILAVAKVFVGRREITEREIEFWIEHVEHGAGTPTENLREYFKAMNKKGLVSTTLEEIDQFLGIVEPKSDG